VRTRGRVAALLEVGTGFHPELTGRENIFLNAAVLGMSRANTSRHFDEIVDFAGTEKFLDTPVKRYSSGMYLRLAFSVAAHLEPDILIVDEVLAVGDAEFQRKCVRRMSTAEEEGRTVVFVSHDLHTLTRLCQRSLWLDAGRVREDGSTERVVRNYLTSGFTPVDLGDDHAGVGSGPIRLVNVSVRSATAPSSTALLRDDELDIDISLEVVEEYQGLDLALYITNARGVRILDEVLSESLTEHFTIGVHKFSLRLPPILNVGEYTIGIWVGTATTTILEEPSAGTFELHGSDRNRPERAVVLDLAFRRTE
jgi:ABC-2 type transport system ATP-binding protein/lipopolysaccharide transport system ATP-binding protein